MFYLLYEWFGESVGLLNLFKYITFRTGGAVLTALLLFLLFGSRCIAAMKRWQQEGQPIRADGPKTHIETKRGTPTMGGVMILGFWAVSLLLWADITDPYVLIAIFITAVYGALGFADDYLKVKKRDPKGVPGKMKLLVQFAAAFAGIAAFVYVTPEPLSTQLVFPLFKNLTPDIGLLFFLFAAVVIVGASNAVNLTDGLDGLATVPVMIAAGCYAFIAYLVGHANYAAYLAIPHLPGTGELAVFCGGLIGAGLGFLWFNAPPARIFMGDVGSLPLGGALGAVSVMTKHEIVLSIIGGLFVAEALSVILQVYYYKFSGGKRLFRMAPLHHHFELKGWSETTVVVRFWIIAFIFAMIGLSTLKLR